MATDLSKLVFDSRQNYMKRSTFVGSTNLTLPSASSGVEHTVSHSLGYAPFFIVGAEQNDTSILWSNRRVHEYTQSSAAGPIPTQLYYWCDNTTLTIRLETDSNGNDTGETRTVYWVIYLDYSQ